jgi:hypothetical protein
MGVQREGLLERRAGARAVPLPHGQQARLLAHGADPGKRLLQLAGARGRAIEVAARQEAARENEPGLEVTGLALERLLGQLRRCGEFAAPRLDPGEAPAPRWRGGSAAAPR